MKPNAEVDTILISLQRRHFGAKEMTEENRKHFERLQNQLSEWQAADLSFSQQLGESGSFKKHDEFKNIICGRYQILMEQFARSGGLLDDPMCETILAAIEREFIDFQKVIQEIKGVAKAGPASGQFINRREEILAEVQSRVRNYVTNDLRPILPVILAAEINWVSKNIDVSNRLRQITFDSESVNNLHLEAISLVESIRTALSVAQTHEAAVTFGIISQRCLWACRGWGMMLLISMAILVILLGWQLLSSPLEIDLNGPETKIKILFITQVIQPFLRNALLISVLLILLRIFLTKYNRASHLLIIYRHREQVLQQYSLYEKTLGDSDTSIAAKHALRLEIAKYVFSDPQTGFAGDNVTDISISPGFSNLTDLMKKATS